MTPYHYGPPRPQKRDSSHTCRCLGHTDTKQCTHHRGGGRGRPSKHSTKPAIACARCWGISVSAPNCRSAEPAGRGRLNVRSARALLTVAPPVDGRRRAGTGGGAAIAIRRNRAPCLPWLACTVRANPRLIRLTVNGFNFEHGFLCARSAAEAAHAQSAMMSSAASKHCCPSRQLAVLTLRSMHRHGQHDRDGDEDGNKDAAPHLSHWPGRCARRAVARRSG